MKSVRSDALHTKMTGRDPNEAHRVTTPLELLFDLTFASAFGLAASQYAQVLAEGHLQAAFVGFGYAGFAICWAWVNFTWFSSAYDTDDWIFRVATMVQMIGVLIVAMGLPRMFASALHGVQLDNTVMVVGYVIMRIALVSQWLRAAKQDSGRRKACLTYAACISVAQIGWVAQVLTHLSGAASLTFIAVLLTLEFSGPALAELKKGGTPWHADHIAERYSLFAIIALGEGVVGTVAAMSAVVERQGWTLEASLVCIAGVGLTFGMWWVYYLLPSAHALRSHRNRAFVWGFAQILIVISIVATGAGFRVAAQFIEQKARVGSFDVVLSVAIPVSVFLGSIYALHAFLSRKAVLQQFWSLVPALAVVAITVRLALSQIDTSMCLAILVFAPVVTILSSEVGRRANRRTN